jgi:hypothetical protein
LFAGNVREILTGVLGPVDDLLIEGRGFALVGKDKADHAVLRSNAFA